MPPKMTNKDFLNKVNEVSSNYKFMESYKDSKTNILVKHLTCGHEYKVKPANFLYGRRCPKCNGKTLKTHEEFLKEFLDTSLGEYELLSEYKKAKDYITVKHLKCNHIYKTKPTNWLSGFRCPKCRQSKGEKTISTILLNKGIEFEEQKRFQDCKNIRTLPFDFYISNYNILIEYQGEQHFRDRETFGRGNELKNIQKRDKIKYDYCQKENIPLYYITYKQDIETELEKIIKHANIELIENITRHCNA